MQSLIISIGFFGLRSNTWQALSREDRSRIISSHVWFHVTPCYGKEKKREKVKKQKRKKSSTCKSTISLSVYWKQKMITKQI